MKRGLIGLTPLQLGSLRIIFAGIFVLTIGFKSLKHPTLNHWKYIVLVSTFSTLLPVYLFAFAQTKISSSVSAILNSLTPINTLLFGVLFFHNLINKKQIIGVVLGFLGSLFLILENMLNHSNENNRYGLLVITCTCCYAIGVNLISNKLKELTPLSIATSSFAVIILPAFLILTYTSFWNVYASKAVLDSLPYVILLGVIGTGMANVLFFRLIQISSPVFASSVTYLVPIVAIVWGFFDGEYIDWKQFMGALIIFFGV